MRSAFFAEEMNQRSIAQVRMLAQIHQALERDEFVLHYQPKLDIRTGKVLSMEALLRWEHPELGLIGPTEFIPIAEKSGVITEIGAWVMRHACTQAKEWVDQGALVFGKYPLRFFLTETSSDLAERLYHSWSSASWS